MKIRFLFFARIIFAWFVAFIVALILWNSLFDRKPPWPFMFIALLVLIFVIASAASHLRRILLIVGTVDAGTLANRQRRQIEIPFEFGEAFDIVDATVRELPRTEQIESVRDSLQIRAKVERVPPYGETTKPWKKMSEAFGIQRNQIFATVTPRDGVGSVTLICEPEGGAWSDWFIVDDGTNLENAEAITRAISRRVADRERRQGNATHHGRRCRLLSVGQ